MLPVVDLHNDLLTAVQHQVERGHGDSFGRTWLPQLVAGGVAVQVLPFYTDEQFVGEGALRRCLLALDLAHRLVAERPDDVVLVRQAADLPADAAEAGSQPVRLVLALEGLEPLGRDLALLRTVHLLGIRMVSFTWNRRTAFADGHEQASAGGRLTPLGVEAVAEAERLRIALDVSHLSEAGFWHLAEVATRPFLASHSSCRALVDHTRNLTDEQIRAVAASGGVVGINFWGRFIGLDADATDPVEAVLDHVEHALAVGGEDTVALGPDFMWDYTRVTDPALGPTVTGELDLLAPAPLRRPDVLPALLDRLSGRVGPQVAGKVAAGNALRVLRTVLA